MSEYEKELVKEIKQEFDALPDSPSLERVKVLLTILLQHAEAK